MMDYVDIGTRSATQGRVGKVIVHMQKGNRMKLKDADKIKEAIQNSDDFVGGSDDIIKVIDSVPEVVISTDTDAISRKAAQIIHDAIDNTTFAEEAYPGIKEQMHRSVEEWEKLQPVFTEIAEEYKKACEISYINKPLAYALHEVWKKHDRRDTKRNE